MRVDELKGMITVGIRQARPERLEMPKRADRNGNNRVMPGRIYIEALAYSKCILPRSERSETQ